MNPEIVHLVYLRRHKKWLLPTMTYCWHTIMRNSDMNPKRCTHCNAPLLGNQKRFCTLRCHQDYNFKLRLAVLIAGDYPPVINNAHFLRRALVQLFGERCSRCGWSERHPKTGRVPIEVEHLDGDWKNNELENLTLLCPNCHALTPTFRALNKGRGRAERWGGRNNPLVKNDPRIRLAALAKQRALLASAEVRVVEVSSTDNVQLRLLIEPA